MEGIQKGTKSLFKMIPNNDSGKQIINNYCCCCTSKRVLFESWFDCYCCYDMNKIQVCSLIGFGKYIAGGFLLRFYNNFRDVGF